MLKTLRLLVLGSLITSTLAGCAGAKSSSAEPTNVTGTWIGGTATGTREMTLRLQQTGTNVTGTLVGAGAADGPITGVVAGNTIDLSAPKPALAPRLVVRGDLMDGFLDGVPLKLVRFGGAQGAR